MSEDEATTTVAEAPPAGTSAPPAEEAPAAAAESVDALPAWAQKLIAKTRTEAATNRARANEQAQALDATRDAIAKALGLKSDDDPVVAAKTAAEERDKARKDAKAARVENAVLRMAKRHEADPDALTDSRAFTRSLEAIDPDAEDFTAQLDTAIAAALEANPSLKLAAPAPAARSGGPVGGGAPLPTQLSRDDLKGMTSAEIEKAREDGRLNQLLGIS